MRRSFRVGALAGAVGALAGAIIAASATAAAQAGYPNRPIRILVGFAPGGPSDIISRVVGTKMGEILGVQVVVEYKTGAGGVIATQEAARSAPDGYTLLNTPLSTVANEILSKTIKYEYGKDIIAVGPQAETANILVVSPSLGVKSVAELVELAKQEPGELQYATAGRGTATHLNSELFNMAAGIKTVPVHYRGGGETVKDLLSGQVKIMFSSIAPVGIRQGRAIDRPCHHRTQARPVVSEPADHCRIGLSGFRRAALDRDDGSSWNAEGHHQQIGGREHEGVGSTRDQDGPGRSGIRTDDRIGRGFRPLLSRRARKVGKGDSGNRHGQGIVAA